jgi:hypothetical protein
MAFIAIEEALGRMLGVVRVHADANYERAEFAVLVRSDMKGRGLGSAHAADHRICPVGRSQGHWGAGAERQHIATDPSDPDTCVVRLAIGNLP